MVQDCDTLAYIIKNCPNVKELSLPYQCGITNFSKYLKIQSKIKLKHFILTDIEYIPPKDVAEFVKKYMINKGELWFWFNLQIPNNYFHEVQALLPKDFIFNVS
uniref:Uncharacterized protein n=1 Tax=Panagrolaimus davidi TaxID=227884 RepID=A0A914QJS1_9BILA